MHFPFLLSALIIVPFTLAAPIESPHPIESPNNCLEPPNYIIRNGDFESGVTPPTSGGTDWTVVGIIGASSYALSQPGNPNGGGRYAFTAALNPGSFSPNSGETLTRNLSTCTGNNYSIKADYHFAAKANGACSISIQYPYKTTRKSVTIGSANSPTSVWYSTGATFQAVSMSDRLDIVFFCSEKADKASNKISVDNMKVVRIP